MLISLKLTNFKKHENLEVNFTGGLNAIRGNNENGKSSLMRAIAFANFGARALELSLEETVTWGKPVSTLKVELTFLHNGKTYTITRKKSGAELVGENGETASGQAEVTSFVEKLFAANAAVAQATMLANQSSLQNGLDSSAMPLIEKLANMRLIDELIDKVQQKLPSGSTKSIEVQLHAIPERAKPEPSDMSAERSELEELKPKLENYKLEVADAKLTVEATKQLAAEGLRKQTQNEQNVALRSQIDGQISNLQTKISAFENYSYEPIDIEQLRELAKSSELAAEIKIAFEAFEALPKSETMASDVFAAQQLALHGRLTEVNEKIQETKTGLALANASKVAEGTCSFCGQDFRDLPEVKSKQALTEAKIAELTEQATKLLEAKVGIVDSSNKLKEFSDAAAKLTAKALPLRKYVSLNQATVPPTPVWEGGVHAVADNDVDYSKLLQDAIASEKSYNLAKAQADSAKISIAELTAKSEAIVDLELSLAEVKAMLVVSEQEAELQQAERAIQAGETRLQALQHKLDMASLEHEMQVKAFDKEVEQRSQLLELLNQHNFHNGIIQKLREARPAVAAKLWALVLTGVSHYFSQIRGTQSTVTRGEKGFLIDGKVVEAYSGSTKDSLGLAIRLMLQKTFLPNVNFMLVDEPGAAFDDTRESDMLAVLAGSGLDQVILVTHSDLADTFAASVIQI